MNKAPDTQRREFVRLNANDESPQSGGVDAMGDHHAHYQRPFPLQSIAKRTVLDCEFEAELVECIESSLPTRIVQSSKITLLRKNERRLWLNPFPPPRRLNTPKVHPDDVDRMIILQGPVICPTRLSPSKGSLDIRTSIPAVYPRSRCILKTLPQTTTIACSHPAAPPSTSTRRPVFLFSRKLFFFRE